jgi:5-methylcytosine-specific restriction endonuclease McrA
MGRPRTPDTERYCQQCGKRLARKRSNGTLEGNRQFNKRLYCDQTCMANAYEGTIKNPTPKNSRRQSAKVVGEVCATCATCGAVKQLHVHHIDLDPMNNDPQNLMTLCASCHHRLHGRTRSATAQRNWPCKACSRPADKAGMCQKHYQRQKKYGDPFLTKRGNQFGVRVVRDDGQ